MLKIFDDTKKCVIIEGAIMMIMKVFLQSHFFRDMKIEIIL